MSNQYKDYRTKIRSGDLIVKAVNKIESLSDLVLAGVQVATRSSYDHTGVAWVISGRVFVIEAVIPKVRIQPVSTYGDFYHLSIGQEWTIDKEDAILKHVGDKYSIIDIIKRASGFSEDGNDTWFCSELTAKYYIETGYATREELGFKPKSVVEGLMEKSGMGLVKVTGDIFGKEEVGV